LKNRYFDIPASTIDKLLIISILIKFLEEIKDDNGRHTLRDLYKENSVQNFSDALENGLCLKILEGLASKFNGKIFDKFSDHEKELINNSNLSLIAQFL